MHLTIWRHLFKRKYSGNNNSCLLLAPPFLCPFAVFDIKVLGQKDSVPKVEQQEEPICEHKQQEQSAEGHDEG